MQARTCVIFVKFLVQVIAAALAAANQGFIHKRGKDGQRCACDLFRRLARARLQMKMKFQKQIENPARFEIATPISC